MVYLKNFAKHLTFTSEGLPNIRWKTNNYQKLRQEWVQKWGHPEPEQSTHLAGVSSV